MPDCRPLPRSLPTERDRGLARKDPWWYGKPLPVLPPFRRWPYAKLRERLDHPIAPIQVIRGPRQIGKTTLQFQLIESLLRDGVQPERILRIQFDDLPALTKWSAKEPILRIVEWFEAVVLGASLNEKAREGLPVFLFLHGGQNFADSPAQLQS